MEYDVDQLGLRIDWDISEKLSMHSITAHHDSKDKVNQDFDGGAINGAAIPFAQLHTLRDQDFEVFSQELRFNFAATEQIEIMLGVYIYDSELEFRQDTNNILQLPPVAIDPGLAGLPCATIAGITGIGLRANSLTGPDGRAKAAGTNSVK